ncbi:Neurochondrin-domain-containing protein [Camillea tinctor]|nr:Neurochondrin-domain-containing protein [Camillea tinctor]
MESPTPQTIIPRHVRKPLFNVKALLKNKNDTSRFVGLTLLKQALDTYPELQDDKVEIASLWDSISPRFLDRLLLTGTKVESNPDHARQMLDFAVGVIRTFALLQPNCAIGITYLERIPKLSAALPYSTKETGQAIVEIMLKLVQARSNTQVYNGAMFMARLDVDIWIPLIEAITDHPDVFTLFQWIWLRGTTGLKDRKERDEIRNKIDRGLQAFVSSSRSYPPRELLGFLSDILRGLDPDLISPDPQWLGSVVKLIKELSMGRQSEEERCAYTNCAATLLQVYPEQAPHLLFLDDPGSSKPFVFLLVTMLQVDFHATVHQLVPMTTEPEYPAVSKRLASVLEVITSFIGHLIGTIDDEDKSTSAEASQNMRNALSPEHILKIRMDVARTIAEAMEYLRDRWDAVLLMNKGHDVKEVASIRKSSCEEPDKLAWDVAKYNFFEDPITPAAIGLIAIWLRDDDGEELRKQGAGLMDVFVELYKKNVSVEYEHLKIPEMRMPILSALEGVLETDEGLEMAERYSLWELLSLDLKRILGYSARRKSLTSSDYLRGRFVCQALHTMLSHQSTTPGGWISLADQVSIHKPPPININMSHEFVETMLQFHLDAVQIGVSLLRKEDPHKKLANENTAERLWVLSKKITRALEIVMKKNLQTIAEEDNPS